MIIEALDNARRNEAPRNPERAAISDLYGCDRATWYRRNGYVVPPHSDATLRKFDVGHAVEAQIARRLSQNGAYVEQDVLVTIKPNETGIETNRIVCDCAVECTCIDRVPMDTMTGHPDLWMPDNGEVLVEIKTTDVRKPEPEAKPHYALQAAAYSLALDARTTIVHVTHVANFDKDEREYEVDAMALLPRIVQRAREVMERTAPGSEMPDVGPPIESAAWACKYCPFGNCEMNENKNATFVHAPRAIA